MFSFFFFGVNRVKKDGAVVARNGKDEDDVDGVEHNVAVLTNDNNRVNSNNIGGDNDANNGVLTTTTTKTQTTTTTTLFSRT